MLVERVNMNIKKILLLLFFSTFICGCEAVYNLDLTSDNTEYITVSGDQEENSLFTSYNFAEPAFYDTFDINEDGTKVEGVEYYEITHQNVLEAKYTFKDSISKSSAIRKCFPSTKIKKDKTVVISTDANFACFNKYPTLSKVTINIKVDDKVIKNNADYVNGNIYTWEFATDSGLRGIYLEYENKDYKENENTSPNKEQNLIPDNKSNYDDKSNSEKKHISSSKRVWIICICLPLFFISLFVIIIGVKVIKNRK